MVLYFMLQSDFVMTLVLLYIGLTVTHPRVRFVTVLSLVAHGPTVHGRVVSVV